MLEVTSSNLLTDFLADHYCLIVEPSQSFAFAVQNTLQAMGVPHPKIHKARRLQDARRIIAEKKPKILISEYEIDHQSSLELFEMQAEYCEPSERISIVITLNSSESAIAEASEGDIDGYLLKPFSMTEFHQKLEGIVNSKLNPSPYYAKLNKGKKLLAQKDFEKAVQEFMEAKPLDSKPTLACFYAGQAFQRLGDTSRALLEFQEGRNLQSLHYRCLTGEFDALFDSKNYSEAFKLVDTIQKNFPVTSERLGRFFIVTVFANRFEVLPRFCQLFNQLDHKPEELVKISSLAMLTSGRFYLKERQFELAAEAFELGFHLSNKSFEFLEKTIFEYLKIEEHTRAQAFFNRASSADYGTPQYKLLEFRVGRHSLSDEGIIKKGQQLIDDGYGNPEIFSAMVKAMAMQGKEILAGSFIGKIQQTHPELSYSLYDILDKNLAVKDKTGS